MRFALASSLVVVVASACRAPDLVQYDDYFPDNELPLGEPTERVFDASAPDARPTDAGGPLAVDDASVPPSNTCEAARSIGTLSGDTSGASLTAEGTCSEWLTLRATEDSTGGAPMRLSLTLTPGDFSLFVSFDPVRDTPTCTNVQASTGTLTWGEGTIPNGSEDGRTVRLAIVKSGPCGASKWTLGVKGGP